MSVFEVLLARGTGVQEEYNEHLRLHFRRHPLPSVYHGLGNHGASFIDRT